MVTWQTGKPKGACLWGLWYIFFFLAISVQMDTTFIELPLSQQTIITSDGEGGLLP